MRSIIRLAALTTVLHLGTQQNGIAQVSPLAEEEAPCWLVCGFAVGVCLVEAADWGFDPSDCTAFFEGCMAGCQAAKDAD